MCVCVLFALLMVERFQVCERERGREREREGGKEGERQRER